MAASFLPPLATVTAATGTTTLPTAVLLAPLMVSAALLVLGTLIVFPFEMDTIVTLSGNRLVATHYGLYNTVCGTGIMLGNLLTGTALDLGRTAGSPALPWLALVGIGLVCAAGVSGLDRAGRLRWPIPAVTSA